MSATSGTSALLTNSSSSLSRSSSPSGSLRGRNAIKIVKIEPTALCKICDTFLILPGKSFKILDCGHSFHHVCFTTYARDKKKCPTCEVENCTLDSAVDRTTSFSNSVLTSDSSSSSSSAVTMEKNDVTTLHLHSSPHSNMIKEPLISKPTDDTCPLTLAHRQQILKKLLSYGVDEDMCSLADQKMLKQFASFDLSQISEIDQEKSPEQIVKKYISPKFSFNPPPAYSDAHRGALPPMDLSKDTQTPSIQILNTFKEENEEDESLDIHVKVTESLSLNDDSQEEFKTNTTK